MLPSCCTDLGHAASTAVQQRAQLDLAPTVTRSPPWLAAAQYAGAQPAGWVSVTPDEQLHCRQQQPRSRLAAVWPMHGLRLGLRCLLRARVRSCGGAAASRDPERTAPLLQRNRPAPTGQPPGNSRHQQQVQQQHVTAASHGGTIPSVPSRYTHSGQCAPAPARWGPCLRLAGVRSGCQTCGCRHCTFPRAGPVRSRRQLRCACMQAAHKQPAQACACMHVQRRNTAAALAAALLRKCAHVFMLSCSSRGMRLL